MHEITMRGAMERLVVPAGRNVAMLMSFNGEMKYAQNGIVIIVK